MIIYYIIGFLIFNVVLYLTQNLFLNIIGLNGEEIDVFLDNNIITMFIYTVLYVAIYIGIYIYDVITIRMLNEKFERMKERVKMNEEAIRSYSGNNSCDDGSFVRSL